MKKQTNIPQLRFPEFKSEWEQIKLGDVSKNISSGKSKGKENDGNYPLYGSTGIIGYLKSFDYSGEKILVARVGANAGSLYKVKGKYCVTDNTLILNLIDSIDADFTYNYLIKKNLNKLSFGSGQPLITGRQLKLFNLFFPSLPEQKRIASFFTVLDKKITELKQKKNLLEQYKKGVMQKLFSQESRFKDENGKYFPNWEKKKLGELGEFVGGGTPPTKQDSFWNGDIPWLSSSDLVDDSIDKLFPTRFITKEAVSKSATKLIPPKSILIISRVGVGKVAINDVEVCTSQDFTNLIPYKDNNLFLAYLIKQQTSKLLAFNQGTSIKGFVKSDLADIKILLPSIIEQSKIANFLSAIDKKIYNTQIQIEKTEQYKKGLLQKMFC